jgi:hypothetical protein
MERFIQLHEKLYLCYNKISYKDYLIWSDEQKDETCLKEREALVEYLNSDKMDFENVVKENLAKRRGRFVF